LGITGDIPLTKDQFTRTLREFEVRDKRFNTIYMVIFFGLLLANIPLSSRIPEQYNGIYLTVFLALLLGNAAAMLWRGKGQAKREGLVCRSCGGGLLGQPGRLALAAGTCPHCKLKAFDE